MSDDKRDGHSSSPPSPRSGSLSPMLSTPLPRARSPSLSAMQLPHASPQPVVTQQQDQPLMQSPRSRSSSLSAMQPPTSGPHPGQMEPVGQMPSPVSSVVPSVVPSPVQQRAAVMPSLRDQQSPLQGRAQSSPNSPRDLSPMRASPPRSETAVSINESPNERSLLVRPVQGAQQGWSRTAVNAATLATQATDAIGAGLSLSAALATSGSPSAVGQNLASGSTWALSGVIGAATGRATNAAWSTASGVFNAFAGASSVTATGFGTAAPDSWQSSYVAPVASYLSNMAWAGAGVSTIGDGVGTMRNASNWSATFAGGAQIASGIANVTAGAAGAASTYLQGQNPLDPRAATAAVVSGAAWVAGSAFGAMGAGLSWYSRRGSAGVADSSAHPALDP